MTADDEGGGDFSEKRRHRRLDTGGPVRVGAAGGTVAGETGNISLGGVAVLSPVKMTSEQFVKLRLGQFDGLAGHVVRQFEGGFAVEFENVKNNGSALEDRLRSLLGSELEDDDSDEITDERARLEARLMAMLGGGDDQQG